MEIIIGRRSVEPDHWPTDKVIRCTEQRTQKREPQTLQVAGAGKRQLHD